MNLLISILILPYLAVAAPKTDIKSCADYLNGYAYVGRASKDLLHAKIDTAIDELKEDVAQQIFRIPVLAEYRQLDASTVNVLKDTLGPTARSRTMEAATELNYVQGQANTLISILRSENRFSNYTDAELAFAINLTQEWLIPVDKAFSLLPDIRVMRKTMGKSADRLLKIFALKSRILTLNFLKTHKMDLPPGLRFDKLFNRFIKDVNAYLATEPKWELPKVKNLVFEREREIRENSLRTDILVRLFADTSP